MKIPISSRRQMLCSVFTQRRSTSCCKSWLVGRPKKRTCRLRKLPPGFSNANRRRTHQSARWSRSSSPKRKLSWCTCLPRRTGTSSADLGPVPPVRWANIDRLSAVGMRPALIGPPASKDQRTDLSLLNHAELQIPVQRRSLNRTPIAHFRVAFAFRSASKISVRCTRKPSALRYVKQLARTGSQQIVDV